ncbi:MAG: iron-containing alcohol dehydrogenase [Synergistaceae bacterium]|jgi:alcohol dehydrogenase|nr:iron-containing alcohol dehydrogenase [Synergistaceae bacterium]
MYTDKRVYSYFYPMMIGRGCVASLGEKVKEQGCERTIVLYDKPLKELGIVDRVLSSLKASNVQYVGWDGVQTDPSADSVNRAAEIARSEGVDGIVAIGGGSAIDTGKAVDVLIHNPGRAEDWFEVKDVKPGVPSFMVSTTSGTASEVTVLAVISDADGKKRLMFPNAAAPRMAVLDPELTLGLPPALTSSTGMDAFSHAAESFTCNLANPLTDRMALDAIRLVAQWLPTAARDGGNLDAREGMQMAQLIAGLSFNNASTHAGHAIAHALGKARHVPHGVGCAFAVGEVLEFFAPDVPKKVREIGLLMGADIPENAAPEEIGRLTRETINAFKKKIHVPTVAERGVTKEQLALLGDDFMLEGGKKYTLREMTASAYIALATTALDNEAADQ